MKVAIITGASSGIGREFALQMDKGFTGIDEFWLIARNEEKLEELAKCLHHKSRILPFDVTGTSSLRELDTMLKAENPHVRMLINCAGYGIMGKFESQDTTETMGMIRLNCEALTRVTKMILPYMKCSSRIIQLASSAAFLPQSDFAVYAATKSYVLSFSRALGSELKAKGIVVTAVCPGPVNTPFFDIAEKNGSTLKIKKLTMVSPERVVKLALQDSYHKKPVSVCGMPIKAFRIMAKLLPHDFLLNIMQLLSKMEK